MAIDENSLLAVLINVGHNWDHSFHELWELRGEEINVLYNTAHPLTENLRDKRLPLPCDIIRGENVRTLYNTEYLHPTNVEEQNGVKERPEIPLEDTDSQRAVEIFLFCIFFNRVELAERALLKIENPIVASLVAAKIYMLAAEKIKWKNWYIRQCFKKTAERFSEIAAKLIDRNVEENADILHRRDAILDDYSPIILIEDSVSRKIHESDVVRDYTYAKFYSGLDDRASWIHFRVFIATLFLPLLPVLVAIPTIVPFRDKSLTFWRKIKCFYTAPLVQLHYHYIFFLGFLLIYGYVVTSAFLPLNMYGEVRGSSEFLKITRTEIILHVWMGHYVLEGILNLMQYYRRTGIHSYIRYRWNILDMLVILFYLMVFIIRFIPYEAPFVISKILLSIDFILSTARMLHLFTANKVLGSQLILIFQMMEALVSFFALFCVLIFGFSIAVEGLRVAPEQIRWFYSQDGHLLNATVNDGGANEGYSAYDWYRIKRLFDWGIWKVVGQVDNVSSDENKPYPIAMWCLAIIFVFCTNIILVTALIALFNNITDHFNKNRTVVWRYEHFMLIKEWSGRDRLPQYFKQALFPPPLNIIWYAFYSVYLCFRRWTSRVNSSETQGENPINRDEERARLQAKLEAEFNMRQRKVSYSKEVNDVVTECRLLSPQEPEQIARTHPRRRILPPVQNS